MARPIKDGVDFFSLDCRMDDEIRYIEAEFGLDGFATVIKLWQAIYGNKGYYAVFTRTVRLMFAGEIGKSVNFVDEVVSRCMDYGVFDRRIYKNYGVLTSSGIQKRYAKMTERRNLLKIDGRYLLISAPENWVIVNNNRVNADNNRVNVDNNGESKKKVKRKEKKEKETTTTTTMGDSIAERKTGGSTAEQIIDLAEVRVSPPKVWEVKKYFEENEPKFTPGVLGGGYDALSEAEKFCAYNAYRGWDCLPNWQAAADLWATRVGSAH